MIQRILRLGLVCSFLISSLQPAAYAAEAAKGAAPLAKLEAVYPVGVGDVVSINVFPVEEYSREVTVQPDGKIELPLVGSLPVKGLNAREIQTLLESGFSKFVANPKITVNVRRFAGRRVAIIGQINSPGYYEFRDGLNLLELVSMAGGPKDMAKPSQTTILRQGGREAEAVQVNLAAVLRGDPDRNLQLKPGDIVYIPKSSFTRSAEWMTMNVLPWATLAGLIATLVVISR
ncbi:MAG TPA: hypothetical protein DCM05_11455 [Elusimicrobia bacterium]|nr:hypothetical protein [Elusimicrobiota bacterium]